MPISRTSASLLVGLALVCVVGGGTSWWFTAADRPVDGCALGVAAREARPELVDADSLLPPGTVGARRRETVDGISGLGPLGPVVAGRVYEGELDAPTMVPFGARLALVRAPPDEAATLTVLDPGSAPDRGTDWSTSISSGEHAPWTTFTGGAVGDRWLSVFSGAQPTALALSTDGGETACLPLPIDGGDVVAVTDQAGSDVVVLASSATAGWWLGSVDPAAGELDSWRTEVGPDTWQEVRSAAGLVVASRWRAATIGTSGVPRPGDAQTPWITAWGWGGDDRWTYPAAGAEPFPAVLLDQDQQGTSYVASFDRGGPWLDAVDAEGERLWRSRLLRGGWSGELWGDVVVVRGPDPRGAAMLRALDVQSGQVRWTVRARQAPPVGDDPRAGFGSPLTEPDAWWVPAPNGLLRIDRRTGDTRRADSTARVDELVRIGAHVVVRSGPALLVTR